MTPKKQSESTTIQLMAKDISYMQSDISELKNLIKDGSSLYVTRQEFDDKIQPLQKIVYGMVGLILLAFAGAIVQLVVVRK